VLAFSSGSLWLSGARISDGSFKQDGAFTYADSHHRLGTLNPLRGSCRQTGTLIITDCLLISGTLTVTGSLSCIDTLNKYGSFLLPAHCMVSIHYHTLAHIGISGFSSCAVRLRYTGSFVSCVTI